MKGKIIVIFLNMTVFLLISHICPAQEPEREKCRLEAIGLFTGFGEGDLEGTKDYEVAPFMVAFGFDIKPWLKRLCINPEGKLEFQIEPFLNPIIGPDVNIEVGTTFLLKYAFPLTKKFQPYAKGGLGLIYTSQHTLEQSTQYNFSSQLGAGFHYFFKEDTAITVEYRFRHISNAGIKDPNSGIDVHFALCGISYFF